MPQMADVTVKKSDGTSNSVYVALTPSAGDKTPAVWRCNADSSIPAHRTEFRLVSGWNDKRNARRVETSGSAPYVSNDASGRPQIMGRVNFGGGAIYVDQNVPDAFVNDKVAEYANFCASPLVKASYASGYAPV
ncbi:TPA_asm: coat protein [ssRNA phage SRR5466725_17]|uniref:Coat protein n=1 Tax=ssRNA phage SRR5466725_17 TaxID=2786415 RepID=A0A8S5L059_9VIRU|nr:coat protein [ssRNA phage SRR5466725_17]DAD50835.1 TPA_asm: coat protein [ssRNA phage SRR5466725_17]